MSSEQLASTDLGPVNYQAQRFHSEAVGEPFQLTGFWGNAITAGILTTFAVDNTTANSSKCVPRITAIHDGTWVTISGAGARADATTTAANTWVTLFTISCAEAATSSSAINLLRPHPGAVRLATNYSSGAVLANGAGCSNDADIAANTEFIGGTAMTSTADNYRLGGGTGAVVGLCRIVALTDLNTFAVQAIFNADLTSGGVYDATMPHLAFHLRYPACPVSRIFNLA